MPRYFRIWYVTSDDGKSLVFFNEDHLPLSQYRFSCSSESALVKGCVTSFLSVALILEFGSCSFGTRPFFCRGSIVV